MNRLKLSILFLLLGVIFLAGCHGDKMILKDGDKHITEEINEVISDYIIQKYSSSSLDIEKQFEVHKVYGSSETNGVTKCLYVVLLMAVLKKIKKSTGMEKKQAVSFITPAVIRLKNEKRRKLFCYRIQRTPRW